MTCVLFTLGSFVALYLGMFVCYLLPWNGGILYGILITIRDNVVFFMGLFLVCGYVVIFLIYWGKTLGYLHDIENQMNQIKNDMLASRRAAEDAEKRKNDLVVYLAHDLKTPLTSVIGYLTLLQDEPELTAAQRARYTGIALDKAERLEDLINEFFDITLFSLTSVTLERRSVNLSLMLEQIADEFAPMLRERGLTCAVSAPPGVMLNCDPDKLQRVFDNLLRNAMNYSYPDSEISVSLRVENGRAEIAFANHGDTIPAEQLERLFEQFYRLDSARTSRTGGSGLGLAIAKEIVELHGGHISAQSADERIVFNVSLPLGVRKS